MASTRDRFHPLVPVIGAFGREGRIWSACRSTGMFNGDNGRVLGYDNSHAYSYRHFMGSIVPDLFISYEELYERFEREWQEIAIKFVNGEEI